MLEVKGRWLWDAKCCLVVVQASLYLADYALFVSVTVIGPFARFSFPLASPPTANVRYIRRRRYLLYNAALSGFY
jgi:hypothetical protein